MFSKPADSLRLQLLRWLLVPLLLLLLVNAWLSNLAAVSTANLAFDRLLMASADAIAENVDVKDGEVVVDLPYAALQLLESNIQERIFYRVVAPGGKTLTGYDDLPLPAKLSPSGEGSVVYAEPYRGEQVHLVAMNKPLYGSALEAPVVIIVAETGEARAALSNQILIEGLLRQAALIVAAGLLVWFGLMRGLRPLSRLRDSIVARSPSDLAPIDASGVQKEVRPLIGALNQHTARIQRLLASRQQLIADASHQMRTPLSEMRTQIEYSLRQDRNDLLRETLVDVHADIDRLARLISQLLLQARTDPEVLQNQRNEVVDLSQLVRATALDYVPAARKRSIDLSFDESAEAAVVMGHALLLRELIANLIDNAILHGRAHGTVTVRVSHGPPAVLEVEDDGPGIAPAEREMVFERFYRGTAAAQAGSGLGLSIVRDICAAHRARIELDTGAAGSGLHVRIVFPALAPGVGPATAAVT
jgi:two-component system sensor histidine kinase TctE